jgi:hypothetical protein
MNRKWAAVLLVALSACLSQAQVTTVTFKTSRNVSFY